MNDNLLHYLAALDDVAIKLNDLRIAYGSRESLAMKRGLATEQEYWGGRLKAIDAVLKILDKLREDKSKPSLF